MDKINLHIKVRIDDLKRQQEMLNEEREYLKAGVSEDLEKHYTVNFAKDLERVNGKIEVLTETIPKLESLLEEVENE